MIPEFYSLDNQAVLPIRDVDPRMLILILSNPDPGTRIPDLTTATKDEGENFFLSYLF